MKHEICCNRFSIDFILQSYDTSSFTTRSFTSLQPAWSCTWVEKTWMEKTWTQSSPWRHQNPMAPIFLLLLIQAKGLAILEEKAREEEKQKNQMQKYYRVTSFSTALSSSSSSSSLHSSGAFTAQILGRDTLCSSNLLDCNEGSVVVLRELLLVRFITHPLLLLLPLQATMGCWTIPAISTPRPPMVTTMATRRDSKTALTRRLIYHYEYRTDFSQKTDSSSSSSLAARDWEWQKGCVWPSTLYLTLALSLALLLSPSLSLSVCLSHSWFCLWGVIFNARISSSIRIGASEIFFALFLHTDWRITISFLALLSLRPIGELQFLGTSFLDTHWRIIVSSLFLLLFFFPFFSWDILENQKFLGSFFLRWIRESQISSHFLPGTESRVLGIFFLRLIRESQFLHCFFFFSFKKSWTGESQFLATFFLKQVGESQIS